MFASETAGEKLRSYTELYRYGSMLITELRMSENTTIYMHIRAMKCSSLLRLYRMFNEIHSLRKDKRIQYDYNQAKINA